MNPTSLLFNSVWTRETIQTILDEHLSFAGSDNYDYLCIRSRTFKPIWECYPDELKQRALLFSPEHTSTNFSLLFKEMFPTRQRIDLLTSFLQHELSTFK